MLAKNIIETDINCRVLPINPTAKQKKINTNNIGFCVAFLIEKKYIRNITA
ncbi:hypothetical protein GCM10022217_05150 [Chryseobacterium ginsenosidimutans]